MVRVKMRKAHEEEYVKTAIKQLNSITFVGVHIDHNQYKRIQEAIIKLQERIGYSCIEETNDNLPNKQGKE
jgi:hypothetical protein